MSSLSKGAATKEGPPSAFLPRADLFPIRNYREEEFGEWMVQSEVKEPLESEFARFAACLID